MKKNLLILLLSIASMQCFAQVTLKQLECNDSTSGYINYCIIEATNAVFTNDVYILIDYGQPQKFIGNSKYIADEEGKKVAFNSFINALNILSSMGWEIKETIINETENGIKKSYLLWRYCEIIE